MAPEVLKLRYSNSNPKQEECPTKLIHHAQSKADVFVLGLIIYYCYNGMNHLYGKRDKRDSNIRTRHRVYDYRKSDDRLLLQLVKDMTVHDPDKRPLALDVLNHPSFWNAEQTMKFFLEVEKEKPKPDKFEMYIKDWTKKIDQVIMDELRDSSAKVGKNFKFEGNSLKSLVEIICFVVSNRSIKEFLISLINLNHCSIRISMRIT